MIYGAGGGDAGNLTQRANPIANDRIIQIKAVLGLLRAPLDLVSATARIIARNKSPPKIMNISWPVAEPS